MCEAPGSVVTLLCSGIQLYSAERRIADCILADVKRASMCTSAELARLSCSSEATVTRLCHKLGFENYRKFQLALARDAMEQQEAQRMRDEGQDELHQALLNILANREEELRATIQAIDTRQLRQILSLLRSCEVMEVVSEGGGLGIIAAGNAPAEALREQIQIAKSLTKKPFGVNIMLMSPFVEEVAQLVAEEKVAVVTTGAGNPSKYMALWKEAGIKVIPVVASVAMAKLMTRLGASALIAEGGESGGHVGELTTMVLVPQVCDATSLPVIAAGGIADGRGVAAAFLLGACGVQMGTRFLSAEECSIHPVYKERILKANDLCTMVTGKRLGHPVRSLRTNFARNYSKAEYGGMDDEALEALGSGALRKAVVEGDLEHGCFLSGQIAAMVHEVQPAADIVRDVIEGAEPVLKGATKWVR